MKHVVGFLIALLVVAGTLSCYIADGWAFAIALPVAIGASYWLRNVDLDIDAY